MCFCQCPHWTQVLIWVNAGRFPLLERSHAWTPKEKGASSSAVRNQRVFCICKPWSPPQVCAVVVESVSKSDSVFWGGRFPLLKASFTVHVRKRRFKHNLWERRKRRSLSPLQTPPPPSINVITRHRRHLLLHRQTKRCRAGFADSRPAISPPSVWREGGCGGGSFSGGPPGPPPPSHSSPATPAAASPAALRSPSVGDKCCR